MLRLDVMKLDVETFEPAPVPTTPYPAPVDGTNTGCTGCGGCSEITCGYTVCDTKCKQC